MGEQKVNSKLMYYDCLNKFKEIYFKDLFTTEHLTTGEIHITSLKYPDGGQDVEANFWGYTLEREGKKYLLPSKKKNDEGEYETLDIGDVLPFYARGLQKVANKGIVYYLINKPLSAKFKTEKKMSMRELVNRIGCLQHSDPEQQLLGVFLGVTAMTDRVYFRLSTPPSFGKDSVVDIFGNLVGGCATIVNPTMAKLEFRTSFKWLVVNEIVDISKAEWRNIQQFLLDAGAFKPFIEKHSRAFGGTKESLDISNLSLGLFFNDIDCYPDPLEYFDFVSKSAVRDRFPAFRLSGVLTEDFNSIKNYDVHKLVSENIEYYKDLIHTISYYRVKDNVLFELKQFKTDKLRNDIPERWKVSIGRVLKVIDLYCENQVEFDKWVGIINSSIEEYVLMVGYVKEFEKFSKRHPVGSDVHSRIMSAFKVTRKWKDKLELLRSGNVVVEDKVLW
jgi:hypothetical protein